MSKRLDSGVTLLELMIALLLSSIILLGWIHTFLSIQNELSRQKEVLSLFSEMSFLTHYVSQKLRMANIPVCQGRVFSPESSVRRVAGNRLTVYECVHFRRAWRWLPVHYFLRKQSFYRKIADSRAVELVSDVVAMKVVAHRFGSVLRGVRFWFVLRTHHPVRDSFAKGYYFEGHSKIIHDKYDYLSWPVDIAFREEAI